MNVEFDPLQNKRERIVGEIHNGPEVYELQANFKGYSTNMHLSIKHNENMVYSEAFPRSEVELDTGTDEALSRLFDYALEDMDDWDFEKEINYIGERIPSKLEY